jgi:hypothetical protein
MLGRGHDLGEEVTLSFLHSSTPTFMADVLLAFRKTHLSANRCQRAKMIERPRQAARRFAHSEPG